MRLLLLGGLLVALGPGTMAAGEDLGHCERQVRDAPGAVESYACFAAYAARTGDTEAAAARLEAHLDDDPGGLHALLQLGRVLTLARDPRGESRLREAIDRYRAEGDLAGEARARSFLMRYYTVSRRFDEAAAEGDAAVAAAGAVGDFELTAAVRLELARLAFLRSDEAAVWSHLRRVELDPAFDDLSADFRCLCLEMLAVVATNMDLPDRARRYRLRVVELADRHGLPDWKAQGLASLAFTELRLAERGDLERSVPRETARAAVDAAVRDGSPSARIAARQAEMILDRLEDGPEAEERFRRLEEAAGSDSSFAYHVYTARGLHALEKDPPDLGAAVEHFRRAAAAAAASGTPRNIASSLANLSAARLRQGPRGSAVQGAVEALDAIESLHDAQTGETMGALLLARYAPLYYELIDALLGAPGEPPEPGRAFEVSERLRSRELLEHLNRTGVSRDTTSEAARRRGEVLGEIAAQQLRLLDDQADRDAIGREVRRLEAEEESLRAALGREDAALAVPRGDELPTVAMVRDELSADEALLSFLVPPPGAGSGCWVLVLTRAGVTAHRLPGRPGLAGEVRFWIGMIRRGDGSEVAGARRLYDELLEPAFAELPPGVEHLILIPDGPLHRLPFDALRPSPTEAPLVERFTISRAPSAAVWLRLRHLGAAEGTRALLLADPQVAGTSPGSNPLRGGPQGRLPHARREARRVLRELGGRGDLLLDENASEGFVKRAEPGRYGLVHLAAHAVVDEEDPARSAILLAGGDGEDGLLQVREVVDLDLRGALVTLSACRSAGGTVMAGEGVLGLARSFFQAGAGVVVGGLWPLRDEETAALMEGFYRRLADGEPVGRALARAKRERLRAGAPTAAWAGVVAMGAAAREPWAGGAPSSIRWRLVLVALAVALLVLLLRRLRGAPPAVR